MDKLPKWYKKLSKKELRDHLLREMNDNINLASENCNLIKELDIVERQLKSAESALVYKEEVIEKYKKLLETAVEHL